MERRSGARGNEVTAAGSSRTSVRSLLPTLFAMVACLVIAVAALSRVTLDFRAWTTEDLRRIRVAERPVDVSELDVVTAAGGQRVMWNGDPAERVYLVTFIYTRCASACLSLGSAFQQLQAELHAPSAPSGVRLVSIAFDLAHDTPQALAEYARRFGVERERWVVAAPSTAAERDRLLEQTGVVVIDDGLGGYAHNAAIHVVVPPGRLVRIFDMAEHREALAFAAQLAR